MKIITVQDITDRPIIDAIAPDDFMLIGDASDNNVVKRVLLSTLKAYFAASSPTPTPSTFALRVNCGGDAYTDSNGKVWSADYGFTGGGTASSDGTEISNTVEDTLFQSERWGTYSYSLPVSPGANYAINLLFAENSSGAFSIGYRRFRVKIDGVTKLDNFDVFAEAGANTALIKSFPITATTNTLVITLESISEENPMMCGIEIVGV